MAQDFFQPPKGSEVGISNLNGPMWEHIRASIAARVRALEAHFAEVGVFASDKLWALGELDDD
jgi:hypothetical protein